MKFCFTFGTRLESQMNLVLELNTKLMFLGY